MDTRVTRLATRQHGVVGRRQLFALGLARSHVDELLRSRRLLPVSRGVYLVAGAPLTTVAEMVAAALRCGPDAAVVGEQVLSMFGVTTAAPDGHVVVLTRPGRRVSGIEWRWRPDRVDGRAPRASVNGVPSYVPAISLAELAVDVDDTRLAAVVDGCRWAGMLDRAVAVIAGMPDHPGCRRLLDSGLVDRGAPESPPERKLDPTMRELGAERQVWVTPTRRVDWFFRAAGLVVEYRGEAPHAGPEAREADGRRDAELYALGLAVEHIGARHLADIPATRAWIAGLLRVLGDRPHALR